MPHPHPSHKLKSWRGDVEKPMVFCVICGKEENEEAIMEPCPGKYFHEPSIVENSGLKDIDKDKEHN